MTFNRYHRTTLSTLVKFMWKKSWTPDSSYEFSSNRNSSRVSVTWSPHLDDIFFTALFISLKNNKTLSRIFIFIRSNYALCTVPISVIRSTVPTFANDSSHSNQLDFESLPISDIYSSEYLRHIKHQLHKTNVSKIQ